MKRLLRKTVYEYDYVEEIEDSEDSDYEEEVSESDC
jgi:hypothetical protein